MSTYRKSSLEEEFEKHFSSERGAWANAWEPVWEIAKPSETVSYGDPGKDLLVKSDFSEMREEEAS